MKLLATTALLALMLAGCATTNEAIHRDYYAAQANVATQESLSEKASADAYAQAIAACKTDACVANVTITRVAEQGFKAAGRGGGGQQIAAPQRDPTRIEQFTQVLGAVTPLAGVLSQSWVNYKQSGFNRDIALGQQASDLGQIQAVTGLGADGFGALRDLGSAGFTQFGSLPPTLSVGGDYNTGHIGDSAGGDMLTAGNDLQVGDNRQGHDIAGNLIDQSGNSGNIGDGSRFGSPGPYTDDNSGPRCTGDQCQGTGLPLTDPDPDPTDPEAPITGPRPPGG